jgi:hypothetical protein
MSLLPMALFAALPCTVALRWYLVLQPILAGLGLYWFLRSEGISRSGATVGGLTFSLSLAGSLLVGAPYFTGAAAWTALSLAAASRCVRSPGWPSRLVWMALTAVAWGQLAASHFSSGLVVGSAGLAAYVIGAVASKLRMRSMARADALLILLLFGLSLPLVSLAYLLPRLEYLPRTTLGLGYAQLDALSRQLSQGRAGAYALDAFGGRAGPTWPLRLALAPGLYVGAIALILVLASWWTRRKHLAWVFSMYGAACYLLSIARPSDKALLGSSTLVSFYLHAPFRFCLGVLIALAVLAGLGVDAWRETRSAVSRAWMVGPALLVWGALPLVLGAAPARLVAFLTGAVVGLAALALSARWTRLAIIVPVAVALDLTLSGVVGQIPRPVATVRAAEHRSRMPSLFPPYRYQPPIDLGAYVRQGGIVRALREGDDGRYVSLDAKAWIPQGYHVHAEPNTWGLLARQQSMLFELEEAQVYNSVQPIRYWTFVRTVDPKAIRYAAGFFRRLPSVARDLLQIGWVVGPTDQPPDAGAVDKVASDGPWTLYRLKATPPRASIVGSWRVVGSPGKGLDAVASPAFDPSREVVLEQDPGLRASAASVPQGSRSATYQPLGAGTARVDVVTPSPAIVLVRNTWDPHWHATVDGDSAPVLAADYIDQAIPVGPGKHTIVLTYDDPAIGFGLLGSALTLVALFGAALVARSASKRAGRQDGSRTA